MDLSSSSFLRAPHVITSHQLVTNNLVDEMSGADSDMSTFPSRESRTPVGELTLLSVPVGVSGLDTGAAA